MGRGLSGARNEDRWDRKGGWDIADLLFRSKSRKHTFDLFNPPLTPPLLAFVASLLPDDRVHAIAANSGVSTAVDERRRKVVGTIIQIKRIMNVMNLTDTTQPSASSVETL